MNTPNIIEHLKTRFQQKRSAHPSFKLMEIDDNLFPNGIVTFESEALDSNDALKTVSEIVADSWKKGEKNHLMIQGRGGIGKTVTLLSFPDKFNSANVPSIYIPLHEIRGDGNDDLIERYIKKRVLDDDEELFRQLKVLRKQEWNNGPSLLLLLDGFNEISNDYRRAISEDIEQWSEYYPGVQIITSSRFDIHQYVSLRSRFSKIELQPLSEDTVLKYLGSNGIDIPRKPVIIKVITIPLLLTLYIKTETIRKKRPSPFAKFLETKNAGTLIWNYLQCELWRFRNNNTEGISCVLAMEFIAPYVAWTMQQKSEFVVSESSFLDKIDEAYKLMKKHYDGDSVVFREHIQNVLHQATGLPNTVTLSTLLKESLCLFIGNDGVYKLMHQHFRDTLAAMHLINSIYLSGDSRPTEWNEPVDNYVIQFVADLISENEANRLWEQNRTSPRLDTATLNQLELQKRLHDYDFSELDFGGLNLSSISLYPYRVNNTMLKLPTDADKMVNTVFSEKTFSPEGHTDEVLTVAISPNGKYIVSGSKDKTIRKWDIKTGTYVGELIKGHLGSVNTVAITPDGRYIISGSDDNTIRIWDFVTGQSIRDPLKGHESFVNAIAITSDGKYIVSGSDDKTIRVWEIASGYQIGEPIEGHEAGVSSIAISLDGNYIISGSWDKTIRIWDLKTGNPIRKLKGHNYSLLSIALALDGDRIISGSRDGTIRKWDINTGAPIGNPMIGHNGWVYAVAITRDNKRIVSGSSDNCLRIWDLETGASIGDPLIGHKDTVTSIAVTQDGKRVVSSSKDSTICIWDIEKGLLVGEPIKRYKSDLKVVAVTPDNKQIVSQSDDRTIRFWDIETRLPVGKPFKGYQERAEAITITPDGNRITCASDDCSICFLNIKTGTLTRTPIKGHKHNVKAIALTPDGKKVVCLFRDNKLDILDSENGKPLCSIDYFSTVTIASNSKFIIGQNQKDTIDILDLETANFISQRIPAYGQVIQAATIPNNRIRINSMDNSIICYWDIDADFKCKCIRSFKVAENNIPIDSVVMVPNGKQIIIKSRDKTIHIWDLDNLSKLGECILDTDISLDRSVITKNSKHIVCGAHDGTICIINIETHEVKHIHLLPLSFFGLNFSKAIMSNELKELLRQNGAIV